MADFLTANELLLVKLMASEGVDPVPVVGTNAVRFESASINPVYETETYEERTGTLDVDRQAQAGFYFGGDFSCLLRGSGTPGTAPDFGPMLEACAFDHSTLGSAVSGTATGTGTTTTIDVADATGIKPGHVIEITGGTGVAAKTMDNLRPIESIAGNEVTVAVPWFGGAIPDNTTTYTVRVQDLYQSGNSDEKVAIYKYDRATGGGNALFKAALDVVADLTMEFAPNTSPIIRFQNLRGSPVTPSDQADPGNATFQTSSRIVLNNARSYLGTALECAPSLTISTNNNIVNPPCWNEESGYEGAYISKRGIAGRINPPKRNLADRPVYASISQGTTFALWFVMGSSWGNRVSVLLRSIAYAGVNDEDVNGRSHQALDFSNRDYTGLGLMISFL